MAENIKKEKLELLSQLIAAIQEFESTWNSAVSSLEANDTQYDKAA